MNQRIISLVDKSENHIAALKAVAFKVCEDCVILDWDKPECRHVVSNHYYNGPNHPTIHTRGDAMVVIGHFNRPNALELNVAAIRYFNGDKVPILISDDHSDGFSPRPKRGSKYGHVVRIAAEYPNVFLWPNHFRIGHAGGDLGAFWKGLNWAGCGGWDGLNWRGNNGYDVVFKLSQRFIITIPNWVHHWSHVLMHSEFETLGRNCNTHGFDLRTEAVGLKTGKWFTPQILAHLAPRPVGIAAEAVVYEVVRDHFNGRLLNWDLLSDGRNVKASSYIFRGANTTEEYAELARFLGLEIDPITTEDSNETSDYRLG